MLDTELSLTHTSTHYDTLLNLFWIFEYVTSEPFAGPLSADFTDVKKVQSRFSAICILTFKSKTSIKV